MESVLALSNGYLGLRSSFEEEITDVESMQGTYVAGVFDATVNQTMLRLKGRPSHPRQMVNLPDFQGIAITFDGEPLDLAVCTLHAYERTLDLQRGLLTRNFTCTTPHGRRVQLSFTRFLSRARKHLAVFDVAITPLDQEVLVELASMVNGDVQNVTARHLTEIAPVWDEYYHGLTCQTSQTGISIAVLAHEQLSMPAAFISNPSDASPVSRRISCARCGQGETLRFEKVVAVTTSRDADVTGGVLAACEAFLAEGVQLGVAALRAEHEAAWAACWRIMDMAIEEHSDASTLTQGLRYSLFQMAQNAPDHDATVNIGAKGLSGEYYAGTYFWDTEVFMLPLFAFTQPQVARNLVQFRVHTLPGARRKAAELGLAGAAYPFMADANGDESTTLWQFGLMGIHVTADVAWGVWFYYCVTGDLDFLAGGGVDVLVETSRCWLSRIFYRQDLDRYVINRVLGPDEYHQGVDNNYYTNIMARENLRAAVGALALLHRQQPEAYQAAAARLAITDEEIARFSTIADGIYLPYDALQQVNLQDDRFHLLEPYDLQANPPGGPINLVWSYDRCLRTQLLRQADLVVAHILLGDQFTPAQMQRDFAYYEPKTTHDSSLSFCSYSIIAARLKRLDLAYAYFLKTARLDLDDAQGNTWMGLHMANLAGAWQCVVLGFGGVRWHGEQLSLDPVLPAQWKRYTFSVIWRQARIQVTVQPGAVELATDGQLIEAMLGETSVRITATPTVWPYQTQYEEEATSDWSSTCHRT